MAEQPVADNGSAAAPQVTAEELAQAEADHLLARKLLEKEPEQAAELLTKVLEIKSRKYGDQSEECISAWTHYGRALFENARGHTDAVASKSMKRKATSQAAGGASTSTAVDNKETKPSSSTPQQPAAAAVEVQPSEVPAAAEEGTTAGELAPSQPATTDNKPATQQGDTDDQDDDDGDDDDSEGGDESGSDESEGEGEEGEGAGEGDLELAWEALELARVLCMKYGATKHASYLADVHLTLGELSAEKESFETALEEYDKCEQVLQGMQPQDHRRLSEVHFNSMTTHMMLDQLPEALTHCQAAINQLKQSRKQVMIVMDTPVEGENDDEAEAELERLEQQLDGIDQALGELKEKEQELQTAIKEQISFKNVLKNKLQQIMALQQGATGDANNGASGSGSAPAPVPAAATAGDAAGIAAGTAAGIAAGSETAAAAVAAPAQPAAPGPVQNLGVAGRGRSRITLQPCQPTSGNVAAAKGTSPAAAGTAGTDAALLKRAAGEVVGSGGKAVAGGEGVEEGGW